MKRLALSLAVFLVPLATSSLQGQDDRSTGYVKRATWHETMLASRAAHRAAHKQQDVALGPWHVTRPLPAQNFADALSPEQGVDLSARDEKGRRQWRARPVLVDGKVHGLPKKDRASTYLFRTITSAAAVTRTAGLGSDDGIVVWLNGEKLLAHDVPRGPGKDQERVTLALQPGENRLLLKIHNRAGGHGFYFRLHDDTLRLLWERIAVDFPEQCARMCRDLPKAGHLAWFREGDGAEVSRGILDELVRELALEAGDLAAEVAALRSSDSGSNDKRWLEFYWHLGRLRDQREVVQALNLPALRRAVEDLGMKRRVAELAQHEKNLAQIRKTLAQPSRDDLGRVEGTLIAIAAFRNTALLANPLLDFDRLLLVKRRADSPALGLPQNWQGNCSLPRKGYDDELMILSFPDKKRTLSSFWKPETPAQIADVDLHFDADRMLFSMIGENGRWQIWELGADGKSLRPVSKGEHADVDDYDACYLPDGRIIFDSTRCFQGIPCVGGADAVANLHIMDADGGNIRQLCFDQDHDWCPTLLHNGRILYTRWEYSDTPHYFSRLLMHMNPDGTGQMEYYGSNSFWPNSVFYARPIPGHPTQFVGIVSGHHGVRRMGELVIFDPAKGRFEADGVVQRIPGFGKKVEPVIVDRLVDNSWPRFLHPFPLSDKYFLVSCQPAPDKPWGIYLVDVFDNVLCLKAEAGYALLEPQPFRKRTRPPVIPDKIDKDSREATVFMADVYHGPGLAGVPRGTVKKLRVYEFHYGYNKMGGHKHVGIEGPWDVHRILGTVPVLEDGSAAFVVPANTPLAVQPLDKEGKAIQVMRSWLTAMPGEVLSCVGCHDNQNAAPPVKPALAARRGPVAIDPFYGPTRGFSFKREVQPVLDRHCVGCHDGRPKEDKPALIDLRAREEAGWNNFTPAYIALHPYVRRPGPESDYHLQPAMEYHADTSELVQMLQKGHHGVELDRESWDRLVTWIDLNVPDHGTWSEQAPIPANLRARRQEMLARYANRHGDPEAIPAIQGVAIEFRAPEATAKTPVVVPDCAGWPFEPEAARAKVAATKLSKTKRLDLGAGVKLELVLVPTGSFVMGDKTGTPDEYPLTKVSIDAPFFMGRFEVTREQFNRFDPEHFNGYHDQNHKDHTTPGYPANGPQRPAIRVSWQEAMAFCEWLAKKTGLTCTLPTEAQWEWACRAGAATPLWYGDLDSDFSRIANLADRSTRRLAVTGINPQPIKNPSRFEDWLPKDARFDDGERLMCDVGRYKANAWGLHDMHGNVCEWTRTDHAAYPYRADDGRHSLSPSRKKVVRGGSWRDRPRHARSAQRLAYQAWQKVYNVGFRVIVIPGRGR